ncbi:MAG TPA: alpha/beta hydrolase [Thermoleophilaceae bacterium]|nr:alpha/beta hydrolase [Thermoleophilaceae bacterium]
MGDPPGHPEPPGVLARRRAVRRRLTRSFLILHGLEGSGPGHWQTWLAGRLRERGEDVRYPDLPDPLDPTPDEWLAALRPELAALEGERIVLCHSLACLLWMLNARDGATGAAERVLLVAPPCIDDHEQVGRFRPDGVTANDLERAARETLMFCGSPDPYCPGTALRAFGALVPNAIGAPGAGHVNTDAGYGPWPAVEEWARGERPDLVGN